MKSQKATEVKRLKKEISDLQKKLKLQEARLKSSVDNLATKKHVLELVTDERFVVTKFESKDVGDETIVTLVAVRL